MYSLAISAVRVVSMTILAFVFAVSHVSAQTSIVGSDGVKYEIQEKPTPPPIPVYTGESKVAEKAACQLTGKTFLYKKRVYLCDNHYRKGWSFDQKWWGKH